MAAFLRLERGCGSECHDFRFLQTGFLLNGDVTQVFGHPALHQQRDRFRGARIDHGSECFPVFMSCCSSIDWARGIRRRGRYASASGISDSTSSMRQGALFQLMLRSNAVCQAGFFQPRSDIRASSRFRHGVKQAECSARQPSTRPASARRCAARYACQHEREGRPAATHTARARAILPSKVPATACDFACVCLRPQRTRVKRQSAARSRGACCRPA